MLQASGQIKTLAGQLGGGEVYLRCNRYFQFSRFFLKYQAICRLIFLQALIGPTFEPDLSLWIDAAVQELEAA